MKQKTMDTGSSDVKLTDEDKQNSKTKGRTQSAATYVTWTPAYRLSHSSYLGGFRNIMLSLSVPKLFVTLYAYYDKNQSLSEVHFLHIALSLSDYSYYKTTG